MIKPPAWWQIVLAMSLACGILFVAIFLPIYARRDAEAPTMKRIPAPRECQLGETFDPIAQMCTASFRAPLAFDGSIMDPRVDVCSDFYGHMCGKWIAQHQGANMHRLFTSAHYHNEGVVKRLVAGEASQAGHASTSAVTRFYQSCLHTPRQETILEYKHVMEKIATPIRSHADLPVAFGRLMRYGYTGPFGLEIVRDPNSTRVLPVFYPDNFPEDLQEHHIYQMLQQNHDMTVYNVAELQQRMIGIMKVIRTLREKVGGTASPSQVVEWFGKRPWILRGKQVDSAFNEYFQALDGQSLRFHHDQDVWWYDKPYFDWLFSAQGMGALEINEWRAFIEFSILYNGNKFEPELAEDVYFSGRASRDFWRRPLKRHGHLRPKRKRSPASRDTLRAEDCLRITTHMLPGLIAKQFLDENLPERATMAAQVKEMVRLIVESFRNQVGDHTMWLNQTEKLTLFRKLDNLIIRVAEPDEWTPEPFAERIYEDRYDHNMNLVRMYRVERNMALWHKDRPDKFDRSEIAKFLMPTTETNAYYDPSTNSITILGGMLMEPFFSLRYNSVSKWAILGSIIGHELSHMIDSSGLYFDENGLYRPHGIIDMEKFYKQTRCILSEWNSTFQNCTVDFEYGNATLGEDMADVGGISLAFEAFFERTDEGRAAPVGAKQHFFMILAQAMCESYDEVRTCDAVLHDEHAIASIRINSAYRNLRPFLSAFGCQAKSEKLCKPYG